MDTHFNMAVSFILIAAYLKPHLLTKCVKSYMYHKLTVVHSVAVKRNLQRDCQSGRLDSKTVMKLNLKV